MKITPVQVEWIDSVQSYGWGSLKEPSDMGCVSIGHMISKTKDRVTLALNVSPRNGSVGQLVEIPMIAVKKIKRLK